MVIIIFTLQIYDTIGLIIATYNDNAYFLFFPNHIILNPPQVCMMCDHFRQSAEWTFALDNLNLG